METIKILHRVGDYFLPDGEEELIKFLTGSVLAPNILFALDVTPKLFPAIFCKLNSFYTVVCVVSSVLTLSAISCDRFMAVFCPLQVRLTNFDQTFATIFSDYFGS